MAKELSYSLIYTIFRKNNGLTALDLLLAHTHTIGLVIHYHKN